MFGLLTDKLTALQRRLRGYGRLSETELSQSLREIRTIMLEADVNYKVVGHFVRSVEAALKEKNVAASLKPGEVVAVALYEQLTRLLGTAALKLDLSAAPAVLSLVGLQGTGKTTLAGKLAFRFKSRRPVLVACDPKRPAAALQLQSVAGRANCDFFPVSGSVVDTCLAALEQARARRNGIVILDTAGRLHIDEGMMAELAAVERAARPHATLLVLDGMVGQDAVSQAEQFRNRLNLTGCCFTKLDGDARGGAVVSVRHVTGLPVVFVGTGEHLADLEEFHPDRIASRILGMGDMRTLADKVQAAADGIDQKAAAEKFLKGRFDFEDFLNQLRTVKKMGSFSKLVAMIPGGSDLEVDEGEFTRIEAMIQSMTREERHHPDIIDGSRRRRIAEGSGVSVSDVNRLLKDFEQAKALSRQLSGRTLPRFRAR
jgi:signal recognition particle subunit SRP54